MKARLLPPVPRIPGPASFPRRREPTGLWSGRPAPGLSGRWKGAHRLALPAS
ncbi:hypothetical protein [Usitatibacter rugosus]|uniref:hypothetical protein n=1 Tax=Usitatibacter rugosus TaxID=2732067 RepID=UPI0014889F3E|nr:hypothetical protein [Usitatibacter rugosus]